MAPPVARFASLSADRIRALVLPPPLEGSDAQLAELAQVLRLQAQVTVADIQRAADDVQRAPAAWVQWLLGDSFDAAKHTHAMRLLTDVHDNARVAVGVANSSFDFRLRPWVHPQVQALLKSEQTGRERYLANLAAKRVPLVAGPSSYPSARSLATRLWAHTLSELWPEKREIWFEAARNSAQHRLAVGAHYPSDVTAAVAIADALWVEIQNSSAFQSELAAARTEIETRR